MKAIPVAFFQKYLVWMLIHWVSYNKLLQNIRMQFDQEIWYQRSYLCPPAKEMSW